MRPPPLLAFAHQALDEQQLSASIWAYKRVLAREPKNPEALVHMGTILAMAGHMDQALANMAEALRVDPKYAHAYWDRGHLLTSAPSRTTRGPSPTSRPFSRSSPPARMPIGRAP